MASQVEVGRLGYVFREIQDGKTVLVKVARLGIGGSGKNIIRLRVNPWAAGPGRLEELGDGAPAHRRHRLDLDSHDPGWLAGLCSPTKPCSSLCPTRQRIVYVYGTALGYPT